VAQVVKVSEVSVAPDKGVEDIYLGNEQPREIGYIEIRAYEHNNREQVSVHVYLKADEKGRIPNEIRDPFTYLLGYSLTEDWGVLSDDKKYRYDYEEFQEDENDWGHNKAQKYIDEIKEALLKAKENAKNRKKFIEQYNGKIIKIYL